MKSLLTIFAFVMFCSFAFGQSMDIAVDGGAPTTVTAAGNPNVGGLAVTYGKDNKTLLLSFTISSATPTGASVVTIDNGTTTFDAAVTVFFGVGTASASIGIEGGEGDISCAPGASFSILYDEDASGGLNGDDVAVVVTSVLPVEFTTFTATSMNNNTVSLNWETGSEANNDFFTVERSKDGTNFNALGEVDGAGTSTEARSYEFSDATPLNGKSYYRIKQTDFDGTFSYSDVVMVDAKRTNQVILLPTASYNGITVQTSGAAADRMVVITDMLGQQIEVLNIAAEATQLELNIEGYAKGAYNISIYEGDVVTTKRFVKL